MRLLHFGIAIGLALCALASAGTPRKFSDDQWREDIQAFAKDLRSTHLKPFHAVPEKKFDAALNDLLGRLPQLSDEQIALE